MKKLLTTISVCLLATAGLLAQGRINFNNSSVTPLRIRNSNDGSFVVLGTASTAMFGIGPASVVIQLFAGLTSTSLSPVLIGTGANQLYVTNTASSIAAAQGTFNGGNELPLPGFDGSTVAFLQMTFTSINGQYFGQSSIIQVIPTLAPNAATPVFGAPFTANAWDAADPWTDSGMPSIAIEIGIPEPSALALIGLGFSTLLLARRRK